MIIYGVALLSVSLIFVLIGEALGVMLGVDANVGGVGIAMLFLVFASNSNVIKTPTEGAAGEASPGDAMYIPIVVAMAARQDVAAAADGGMLALQRE